MKKVTIFALKGPESSGISGGFEVYEEEFARALELKGFRIEIYCGRDKGEENLPSLEKISDNISVRRFNSPLNFLPFSLLPMHWYYLIKGRRHTDYIIENQSVIPLLTPIYKKKSIITIIHHLTGTDFLRKQGVVKGLVGVFGEKIILPFLYRKQNIITVSEHSKNDIVNAGLNKELITVIPPIIRTSGKKYSSNRHRDNVVSYIGRYTGKGGNKRIDHIIEIFPEILRSVPDAKLIIAGSMKKESELKELVNKKNIQKHVEFRGFISNEEKKEILSNSKIFASPSYQEGFGITYIEANSYGTPVVGYEILGLDTVPNDSGIMVPKDDKRALSRAIIDLLNDDEQWVEKWNGAKNNAQKYEMKEIQNKIANYIRNIIK